MSRILVVDDQPGYRQFLCRFLGTHGFEMEQAGDGNEGLAIARVRKPELIFMDWCLRGESGLEVVQSLRDEPATASIPVVMMSGLKDSAEDEAKALWAGADYFLEKGEIDPGNHRAVDVFLRHMRALILRGAHSRLRPHTTRVYEVADLRFDAANADLFVAGRRVHLPPKELALLEFFLRHPDVLHGGERIWRAVWGSPHGNWEHTLASTVSALRKALTFEWSSRLVNVKGCGYKLVLREPFKLV